MAWRRIKVRESRGKGRCPYCFDDLNDVITKCSDCRATYHLACWDELRGCATIGCAQAPSEPVRPTPLPCPFRGCGLYPEAEERYCPAHLEQLQEYEWSARNRARPQGTIKSNLLTLFQEDRAKVVGWIVVVLLYFIFQFMKRSPY